MFVGVGPALCCGAVEPPDVDTHLLAAGVYVQTNVWCAVLSRKYLFPVCRLLPVSPPCLTYWQHTCTPCPLSAGTLLFVSRWHRLLDLAIIAA